MDAFNDLFILFAILAGATWLVINFPIIGIPLVIIGALKIFGRELRDRAYTYAATRGGYLHR